MQKRQIAANNEQTAISQPWPTSHENDLRISAEFVRLAEARQATISSATLELYSSRLVDYQLEDVREGLTKLSLRPRAEGETAFPDLGTVIGAVKDARRDRRIAEEQREQREAWAAEEAHRRDHPEEYLHWDPHAQLKQMGKAAPDVKASVRTEPTTQCPHCGAVLLLEGARLSALTPAMLREILCVLESLESVEPKKNNPEVEQEGRVTFQGVGGQNP